MMTRRFLMGSMLISLLLGLSACGGSGDSGSGSAPATDLTGSGKIVNLETKDTLVGTGAVATSGSKVSVHYTGWLYDVRATDLHGTKFDSSVDRNQPFSFTLGAGQVIKGWDAGVVGMRVGGKRTLIIPSAQGYGASGQGPIPANAALVFEVQLLSVN